MTRSANAEYGVSKTSFEGVHRYPIRPAIEDRGRVWKYGKNLYSRTAERQLNEAHVQTTIIPTFTHLGIPQSVRLGQISPVA